MTDKQIIIDDCIHLNEWKNCDICEKLIKTKDGTNGKKREHLLTVGDLRCDFYPNCYYKQLKAKEQECEELKKGLNLILTVQKNCKECPHQKLDVDVLVCDLDCATAFKKIAKQTLKKLENKNV